MNYIYLYKMFWSFIFLFICYSSLFLHITYDTLAIAIIMSFATVRLFTLIKKVILGNWLIKNYANSKTYSMLSVNLRTALLSSSSLGLVAITLLINNFFIQLVSLSIFSLILIFIDFQRVRVEERLKDLII